MSDIMDNRNVQAAAIAGGAVAATTVVAPGVVTTVLSGAAAGGSAAAVGAKVALTLMATPAAPFAAIGLMGLGLWAAVKATK